MLNKNQLFWENDRKLRERTGLGFFAAARGVRKPPAQGLCVIAQFLFSRRQYERIFEQIVLDMREEYIDALANKELWHARTSAASSLIVANCLAPVIKAYQEIRKLTD